MATINWNDMEAAHEEASKPAPAGRYIVAVKSASEGESKEKHPQIRLVWEIADGPFKGKVAFESLTFNMDKPNSISMARATLQMLGFKDLREFGNIEPAQRLEMLKGRKVEADLEVNEYNGRVSNRIKQKIRPIGGAAVDGVGAPPPIDKPAAPVNPIAGI